MRLKAAGLDRATHFTFNHMRNGIVSGFGGVKFGIVCARVLRNYSAAQVNGIGSCCCGRLLSPMRFAITDALCWYYIMVC